MGVSTLQAGYASVDISPPTGVDLTGFNARTGPCEGVLDPLEARALVFSDGVGGTAALVTCDLIGLGRNMVARVRRRVAERTGISDAAQLFACSHTHAGPETGVLTTIGIPEPAYLATLEDRLVEVVVRASQDPGQVRIAVRVGDVPDGLAINRVYRKYGQGDAYDRALTVVRLDRDDGTPFATLVSFACHAVALGHAERHASADFVGHLRQRMESEGAGPVLYVNGCGGDVNPASMDNRGRPAAIALGRGLADVAVPLWQAAASNLDDRASANSAPFAVAAHQEWVALPYAEPRSAHEAAALLEQGTERLRSSQQGTPAYRLARAAEVDYALRLLRLHYGGETLPLVQAEVQVLGIGPLALVALPGEIFSSIGLSIKHASPVAAPFTLIAGWSNDNVGYIPDHAAYAEGVSAYEAGSASRWYGHPAPWAPEAGDLLRESALRLLSANLPG